MNENVLLFLVKKNGFNIRSINKENQTEKVCLAAVQQNGLTIQYIHKDNQTPKVCLASIQQNYNTFEYIQNDEFKKNFVNNIYKPINLEGASNETCTICINNNVNCQFKNCIHKYCKECIFNLIKNAKFYCPYCRTKLF